MNDKGTPISPMPLSFDQHPLNNQTETKENGLNPGRARAGNRSKMADSRAGIPVAGAGWQIQNYGFKIPDSKFQKESRW
jgi:hypothetical protein